MKILFIGGTGIISSASTQMAVDRGWDLYLLNRGQTSFRPIPAGAKVLTGDIRDPQSVVKALGQHSFDVVVDWVSYTPDHIEIDLNLFRGRTGQFVFISSASAYQTPPAVVPVTESTVLDNPHWLYSRNKIACEERLVRAYREEKYPITIVRPSHTYDCTSMPIIGGWTVIDRMLKGLPVINHGDGSALWTLTHHKDFARGFLGLMGNVHAIGEAVHITSDEWLSWNQIYEIAGAAAGVKPKIVCVPSDVIAAYDAEWGAELLGDKKPCMMFDNSKIKRLVPGFVCQIPFSQGAREIVAWHLADPARQKTNQKYNESTERILKAFEAVWPRA